MATERVRGVLPSGAIIWVEATTVARSKEKEVAFDPKEALKLDSVGDVINGLAELVMTGIKKAKPKKATAEFSLEVALETGQLTALWVKGSGTANIKITLEWGDGDAHATSPANSVNPGNVNDGKVDAEAPTKPSPQASGTS